jgi:murein L,D-transpeptidase YafK
MNMKTFFLAFVFCAALMGPSAQASAVAQPEIIWDTPAPIDPGQPVVTQIVVTKSNRLMTLLDKDGNTVRTYRVSLGKNPRGSKIREGDGKTPEGRYMIEGRNPNSSYFLSLRISYPSPQDRQRANKMSVSPGGEIFIHGLPNGKEWMKWKYNAYRDWTNGCIAVSNKEMLEIWNLVPNGAEITILP